MTDYTGRHAKIGGKRVSKMAQAKKLARLLDQRVSKAQEHYGESAFSLPNVQTRTVRSKDRVYVLPVYRTSPGPKRERNGKCVTIKPQES